ncbi:hypothetical protein Aduo_014319 [Ancylostoma duodenale]
MLIETTILFVNYASVFSYIIQPKLTNSVRTSSFLSGDSEDRGIEDNGDEQSNGRQTFRRRKMENSRSAYSRPTAFNRYAYRNGYGSNMGAQSREYELSGRLSPFYGYHQNPRFNNIYGAGDQTTPYLFTNDLMSSFEHRPVYNLENLRHIPDRYIENNRYQTSQGYPEAIYQRLMAYFNRYGQNFQSRSRAGRSWHFGESSTIRDSYADEAPLIVSASTSEAQERSELVL